MDFPTQEDPVPELPSVFTDEEPSEEAQGSGPTPPTHSSVRDPARIWSGALGSAFVVVIVLATLGFVEPWVTVDRGVAGTPSYSVLDVPFVSDVGLAWVALLIVLAAVAWLTRQRWLLLIGAALTLVTMVVLAVLAILFHVVPHLLPLWLLPRRARQYVPDIGSGEGPTLALISSVLLLAWFVACAVVRPVAHRLDGGALHWMERHVEALWHRVDLKQQSLAERDHLV
jgi:hypothetical protein